MLVEDDRIAAVESAPIVAEGARRIDCGGRVLMPGLIDAHVHAVITTMDLAAMERRPASLVAQEARRVLERMAQRGFTSVRDAGGADWGMAEATERGLIAGPRLFHSGRVLSQTGGHGDFRPRVDAPQVCACAVHTSGFSHVADGVSAVRKAAREELRRGATQLKIMASGGVASPTDPIGNLQYSAEEMRAAVEEAEGWNTYAMAHAYTTHSNEGMTTTDTTKNQCYVVAKAMKTRCSPEDYAVALGKQFVDSYPLISACEVRVEQAPWQRTKVMGSDHDHGKFILMLIVRAISMTSCSFGYFWLFLVIFGYFQMGN